MNIDRPIEYTEVEKRLKENLVKGKKNMVL